MRGVRVCWYTDCGATNCLGVCATSIDTLLRNTNAIFFAITILRTPPIRELKSDVLSAPNFEKRIVGRVTSALNSFVRWNLLEENPLTGMAQTVE